MREGLSKLLQGSGGDSLPAPHIGRAAVAHAGTDTAGFTKARASSVWAAVVVGRGGRGR